MRKERTCKQCGIEFTPKRSSPDPTKYQFCSPSCKSDSQRCDPVERFWEYVKKGDGCWLWQGGRFKRPSPEIPEYGSHSVNRKRVLAHRYSWLINRGPVPEGLQVCHHCDTPLCVRPDHLFVGTGLDNSRDAQRKGRLRTGPYPNSMLSRWKRGSDHHKSKLTEDDVRELLSLRGMISIHDAARKFGCHPNNIDFIWKRKTWRHVTLTP